MSPDLPTAGRFEGRDHLLPVRVYYEDTDFTGLVYHANYVRYFERGRSDFLRAIGAERFQSQGKLHGLTYVVPPVCGPELTAVQIATGDGGNEAQLPARRRKPAQRFQQLGAHGVHAAAVKGVVQVQKFEGQIAGLGVSSQGL